MGIFIHALDARTGEVVWTNDGDGSIYIKQPHNTDSFAGVAPQGPMAIAGDKLLIPGGRSVPACYDRKTGKLVHFLLNENSAVSLTKAQQLVARDAQRLDGRHRRPGQLSSRCRRGHCLSSPQPATGGVLDLDRRGRVTISSDIVAPVSAQNGTNSPRAESNSDEKGVTA